MSSGRRAFLVGGAAVLLLGGAAVVVERTEPYGFDLTDPFGTRSADAAQQAQQARKAREPNGARHSGPTVAVTRRTLEARTTLDGTLGYAGSHTVLNQARGVFTDLSGVGRIVRRGQVLYRVDGAPVVLLYGRTAAYRELAAGDSATDVEGADVRQLNANLVALGYAHGLRLSATSDQFGWRTTWAVERMQHHLGVERTGKLGLGSVVFAPWPLRVTQVSATPGAPAGPGAQVLQATSAVRQVVVNLTTTQRSLVRLGQPVAIGLPDGHETPGTVTRIGTVATKGESGAATVEVDITPTRAKDTGGLDKAPVKVIVVTGRAKDALVVPVEALLALAGGGYAVEVVPAGDAAHRLVPVTLGMFDDDAGVVQITDSELRAGQRVVVPAS